MPGVVWMLLALASVVFMTEARDHGWRMLWAVSFGFFYMGGYLYAKKRGFLIALQVISKRTGVALPPGLEEDP